MILKPGLVHFVGTPSLPCMMYDVDGLGAGFARLLKFSWQFMQHSRCSLSIQNGMEGSFKSKQ